MVTPPHEAAERRGFHERPPTELNNVDPLCIDERIQRRTAEPGQAAGIVDGSGDRLRGLIGHFGSPVQSGGADEDFS